MADGSNGVDLISATTAQESAACRKLWRAVFANAVMDAARDPEACAWLRTADARFVAHLAGLDPEALDSIEEAVLDRLAAMRRRP